MSYVDRNGERQLRRRSWAWIVVGLIAVLAALGLWLRWSTRPARTDAVDAPAARLETPPRVPLPPAPDATPPGRTVSEPAGSAPVGPAQQATDQAAAAVRVRFVDAQGAPIEGVALALPDSGLGPVRSGGGGVARLPLEDVLDGAGERTLVLEARAAGFALDHRRARAVEGEELLLGDWTLVAGGSVEGQVLDEEGVGLAGVQVACASDALSAADFERGRRGTLDGLARAGARAMSGPDGTFRLDDVPAGERRLVAVHAERPAALSRAFRVPAGGLARGVEVEMEPADGGTTIDGVVLAPDGTPVPHAPFQVRSPASSYQLRAGLDGRFEFRALDRRPVELVASDPERRHRDARRSGVLPGTRGIELRLEAAPELALRVRDPAGQPVERFAVRLSADPGDGVLASFPEEERGQGRFATAAPEQDYAVEVRANGWKPFRLGPFTAGEAQRIECTLAPAQGLTGRVTAGGRPVAGARVALHVELAGDDTLDGVPIRIEPEPEAWTTSGGEGSFLLSVERRGSFALLVEAEGLALAEVGPLLLEPDAEREESVELSPGGTLAVRVRSSTGASVAGRLVVLSRGDGRARTRRTDERGELEVPRLTPGPWWVALVDAEIDPRGGVRTFGTGPREAHPSNCRVVAGQTTRVDLWLEEPAGPACRLAGRLSVDGAPAQGWRVALDREGTLLDELDFHAPGRFQVGAATPGTYRLRLSTGIGDPRTMLVVLETVELVEGERAWSLDLRTGRLEGTCPPPGEALVFFRVQDGRRELLAPLVPDETGRFHCALAPAGAGEIVRHDPVPGGEEHRASVLRRLTVKPGQTTRIDL